MNVFFLSAIVTACASSYSMTEGKKWRSVKSYLTYNNNNRKQKIPLSSDERIFLLSEIVMAVLHNIPWEKEKNVEVLTYLTYSNNNRKQKKTFIWWTYCFYLQLLWLCFIIFHDRRKKRRSVNISYLQQ